MGGKSSPPSPDYVGAAREQAAADAGLTAQQNWANRPTQVTPWGRTGWDTDLQVDPGTGQMVTRWAQYQTLNPQLQSALDQQLGLQSQRSGLAGSFMNRVSSDYAQPFNWGSIDWQNPAGQAINAGAYQTGTTGAQRDVPQQQLDTSAIQRQQLDTTAPQQLTTGNERIDVTGQDTQGLAQTTQTANAANFSADRQRIENELFQRMQPEHDRQSAQLDAQLVNQGLTPGSDQYNQRKQELADNQARERFNAVQQGGQEQQGLQSMLMGQQQQAFGQTEASQQARNQALNSLFQQRAQAGQYGLGAQQQAFGQDAASQQGGTAAKTAQFQQDLAAQQAQNAARQAQYQQALSSGQFSNAALQQMFGQNVAANAQNYTQAMNSSQYQNQLRQQAIAEQMQRRNMSLNEMNAMLTGQQVQSPQMPGFNSAAASQAPDLLGAAKATGQSQLDQFNAQQQGMQGLFSGAMGLGSSAMMM
jgi:hypothetical protein